MDAPCEPVVYVGERPSELCVVTPFRNLAQYAEEAACQMKVRTCIAVSGFDNDVAVAVEMLRAENPKLLATRGHAAHALRNKTAVPVLSIGYSAENFFETLLPYQNSGMRVGHICFPGQGKNFLKIAQILGLEGCRLEVEDRDNIDSALQLARDKNLALLVGGYGLISKAREQGVNAIPLLLENREAVYQAFAEAKYILAMDAMNKHRGMFITAVLNINPNIIVVVDDRSVIRYANDSAMKTFRPLSPDILGLPLHAVFPCIASGGVFPGSAERDGGEVLTDALRREFLCNAVRISLHQGFEGHVLSLRSVAEVRKNERKVRQKAHDRNPRPLFGFEDIGGDSPAITRARQMALRFADSDEPVLIVGSTGTGKEMFAQAIHSRGKRRASAFVTVNCASLPENLLESELFGYEDGAFTGARRGGKTGLFELAHGGTLFLDEIGEMSLHLQARLLRVLQDKIVMRVGGTRFTPVDARIICATNRNILAMAEEGSFREDLFYRINTLILKLPDLEERTEDIGPLVHSYVDSYNSRRGKTVAITSDAIEKLKKSAWRGNVRELLHVIDRSIVISKNSVISSEALLFDSVLLDTAIRPDKDGIIIKEAHAPHGEAAIIREALVAHRYNKRETAHALGMSRATLWRKMKQYAL